MTAWMNSPHHRENILGDYSEIGVARAEAADGVPYWCVEFGRPFPRLDPAQGRGGAGRAAEPRPGRRRQAALRVSPGLAKAARTIARRHRGQGARLGGTPPRRRRRATPAIPDPIDRVKQSGYRSCKISLTGTLRVADARGRP